MALSATGVPRHALGPVYLRRMTPKFDIFALDVGVPARRSPAPRSSALGWAGPNRTEGKSLGSLVTAVAGALKARPVHLYLEAPLFLPTDPADPASSEADLCAMRPFEHSGGSPRAWMVAKKPWPTSQAKAPHNLSWPWSGNAGGATLGMGLQELIWLLAQLESRAGGQGARLAVDTCPSTNSGGESTDGSACTATESGSADSSTWQLAVLEAFHPQGKYPRVPGGAHGFVPLASPMHEKVAKRICEVADHFGGSPCLLPGCSCVQGGQQAGVWYDSNSFAPGKGTFNLVALACWSAGVSGPAVNAHGWVLCA